MKHLSDSQSDCRPLHAHGLIIVAIGLWAELFLRIGPVAAGTLGFRLTLQHLTGSSVGWGEIAVVAGSVIRIVGLFLCFKLPLRGRSTSGLVVALLMESCLLATSIAFALVLSAEADKEKLAPVAALMNLGLAAGYASAIALTRLLAGISRSLPGERVPTGKRDVRMAVVLGTATLLGAIPAFLPTMEPSSEGSLFSFPLALVIFFAILMAISGVGRFLWLLSYAKSLLSWHRALRDTGSGLFPPTAVGCIGANPSAEPGLSPEGGPRT